MRWSSLALGLGLLFSIAAIPTAAGAQEAPKVINVLNIDANGDQPAFLEIFKRANAIQMRLGLAGSSRAWQATLAGDQTGSLFVAVEYPSLEAMAQAISKMSGDAEWQQLVADFQKSGMRVLSNSASVEITP